MSLLRTGTTLHSVGDDGTTICGADAGELGDVTKHDLLCGKCIDILTDAVVFSDDVAHALEQLLLVRLKAMPYSAYLATAHWQRTRLRAIEHYGDTCALCNGVPINVHHRTYARIGEELLSDLIVLCEGCHSRFHSEVA